MTADDFLNRFRATLTSVAAKLPELAEELREFSTFDRAAVDALPISGEDKAILAESGLPKEAAPVLTFGGRRLTSVPRLSTFCGSNPLFDRYRQIGTRAVSASL